MKGKKGARAKDSDGESVDASGSEEENVLLDENELAEIKKAKKLEKD